jgi:hypothetical protein
MANTTVIAQNTSLVMRIEDLELFDLETGAYADLTTPDSVTFRVRNESTQVAVEVTGNQEGSTNTWNAVHDFTTAGDFTWQCEVVEGSDKGVNELQNVKVVASIADV